MAAAYLRPEVAQEIFGRDERAVLAWGPGPASRAVAVAGGYRVTGTWTFASGSRHAAWLGGHCAVVEPDGTPRRHADGKPVERTMLFPKASAATTDVWRVIGLRGTGSDTFSVADLFVPADRTIARDSEAERVHPGALYRFTTTSLFAVGFASVALGIARSVLDAFLRLAQEKTPRGAASPLRENARVQAETALAEVRLRSARMFLFQSLREIWEEAVRGERVTIDQRMTIRMAATHAIHQAKDVVDAVYQAAGTTVVFESSPFERRFRDMHTVSQQLQGRHAHFETVGRHLLGLEADTRFI